MDSDSVPRSVSVQLPVINFSNQTLKPGSSKWDEVKADVRKALEDYGCFEASFDKLSVGLKKSVFEAMEELFELPIQTKQRNVSSKPFHGYLCYNLYQSLGIDDANVLEKVNDFTQQLWPDHGNKSISETIHRFSEQLVELDVMVRRMIMESFGIEKYIDEHLNSTNYLMRFMKYTSPPDDDDEETKLGLRSHTDKNIITILHQYQVDGLEVKTKDEKWTKVKPSQDSVLVMVGDSLCTFEWSIAFSVSPSHNDGKKDKVFDRTVFNSKNRSYHRFTRRTCRRRASTYIQTL
ncbi:Oxoglutarate/iron-dependent dioxygenase [Arabidopsis thaliana x Arabidopsis arenosa]|uniref:Oxoglutarate/iron-dependent dioxygenase n=1 Tax=Arabidopsis thaliana x Arabidopsis arenosa TaxID=1240361 RepID=A0A8T1Z5K8_9BRAS|nr:Oxoglutarate/iron-dependent dioxygenase [Arabidopsis thaliana x Arabidopsis arenosa]